ncbi:hypothetical protein Fot_57136 [Forsythia ovata]|uniref:Uncharacterized protein n=1 Tax=Forsythia ovata TaxID=205694 RepID=A0ABD1NWP5_9LAMI
MGLFQEVCPSVFSYSPFTCSITHCPATCGWCFSLTLTISKFSTSPTTISQGDFRPSSGKYPGAGPLIQLIFWRNSDELFRDPSTPTHQPFVQHFSIAIPATIGALQQFQLLVGRLQ